MLVTTSAQVHIASTRMQVQADRQTSDPEEPVTAHYDKDADIDIDMDIDRMGKGLELDLELESKLEPELSNLSNLSIRSCRSTQSNWSTQSLQKGGTSEGELSALKNKKAKEGPQRVGAHPATPMEFLSRLESCIDYVLENTPRSRNGHESLNRRQRRQRDQTWAQQQRAAEGDLGTEPHLVQSQLGKIIKALEWQAGRLDIQVELL